MKVSSLLVVLIAFSATPAFALNTMVGIGTTTPAQMLHVARSTVGGNSYLGFFENSSGSGAALVEFQGGGAGKATQMGTTSAGDFVLATNTTEGTYSNERLRVTAAGNVGIGLTPTHGKLDVTSPAGTHAIYSYTAETSSGAYAYYGTCNTGTYAFGAARCDGYAFVGWGNGYVTANMFAASWTTSDIRLKKDVETLSEPLAKVLAMRGVSFRWKKNNEKDIGFVAQEMEKIVPEVVTESKMPVRPDASPEEKAHADTNYKFVSYGKVVAVVVEAVKEIWAHVESHDARITNLERENAALKERLSRLEYALQASRRDGQ